MSATDGPWVLVHDEPYEMSIEANGEKVPGLDCWLDDACFDLNSERLANAKLAAAAPALADAVADLLSVMEMQEKRESGAFHITGDVAFGIWSDAKARAAAALRSAGRQP